MQFHIVTLGVNDLIKSTDFYTRFLKSAPASASNEHITFFNSKGCNLALFPRDELFAHAIECGAKALKTPQTVFWGGYSCYISDEDGYLWEIAWHPFFPKNEKGELMIP